MKRLISFRSAVGIVAVSYAVVSGAVFLAFVISLCALFGGPCSPAEDLLAKIALVFAGIVFVGAPAFVGWLRAPREEPDSDDGWRTAQRPASWPGLVTSIGTWLLVPAIIAGLLVGGRTLQVKQQKIDKEGEKAADALAKRIAPKVDQALAYQPPLDVPGENAIPKARVAFNEAVERAKPKLASQGIIISHVRVVGPPDESIGADLNIIAANTKLCIGYLTIETGAQDAHRGFC